MICRGAFIVFVHQLTIDSSIHLRNENGALMQINAYPLQRLFSLGMCVLMLYPRIRFQYMPGPD